jgi:hypothetical protein
LTNEAAATGAVHWDLVLGRDRELGPKPNNTYTCTVPVSTGNLVMFTNCFGSSTVALTPQTTHKALVMNARIWLIRPAAAAECSGGRGGGGRVI